MSHTFVTVAIPFDGARVEETNAALRLMGNPAEPAIRDAFRDDLVIHFVSISAISGEAGGKAHLLIEASSDSDGPRTRRLLADRLGPFLQSALGAAGLPSDLPRLLERYTVTTGQGLFDIPGLNFTGTPSMTVARIRDEYDLARKVRTLFDTNAYGGSTAEVLAQIRTEIAKDTKLQSLIKPEPTPMLEETPPSSGSSNSFAIGGAVLKKYLWPALPLFGFITIVAAWLGYRFSGAVTSLLLLLVTTALIVLTVIGTAALLYAGLRKRETTDQPDDSIPNEVVLKAVVSRENRTMQNHMTGVSVMKPGRLRRFTLRLAFCIIGSLVARQSRPGFLAQIGTIHFARWILLPGTKQLIFLSNYGGSWESYLEDFITQGHTGLTGVWSNTAGFPRSSNLFFGGAADGERFKRWARRQHQPTAFWYSAYPHLTTERIRTNSAIRQGLTAASTEDEVKAWFAVLGTRLPPSTYLDTPQIQTLLFGGLKHHPHSVCMLLSLPPNPTQARGWLQGAKQEVSFGDQPDPERVSVLALSAGGLAKLGLNERQMATFPLAFRMGISDPVRSNILSDTGQDKPERWIWGNSGRPVDAALLLYTAEPATLTAAVDSAMRNIETAGGSIIHQVSLRDLNARAQQSGGGRRNQDFEAFGFADGVSQPIIKGTRRWLKSSDRIHTVEAGEFLLGYPDNRGGRAFSPLVRAEEDPHNLLPAVDPAYAGFHYPVVNSSGANSNRDLGRNGSYLVIRQLAQDMAAFHQAIAEAASECANHPGMPPGLGKDEREQWIAAKMIGRWRDGTSLIRYPHRPGTGWDGTLDVEPDNDFLLGAEDPVGHRCPFGAHIRRTNPRESFDPGSMQQIDITNRHRILRVGRPYESYCPDDGTTERQGLLFMCLNGDIERQFEFIQQTWAMAMQFLGVDNEVDAILGRGKQSSDSRDRATARLKIPTPHGPIHVRGLRDIVQVRGGGYFFLPSRGALDWLAAI